MTDTHTHVPTEATEAPEPGASEPPLVLTAELGLPVSEAEHTACPVTDVLRRIGDKWTVLVVVLLGRRPMRFNELQRAIEAISQRMLTRTLRNLERDGLVRRTVYATVPPTVDYRLTDLGASLLPPLSALADWAVTHADALTAARTAHDQDPTTAPTPVLPR